METTSEESTAILGANTEGTQSGEYAGPAYVFV